MLTRAEPAIEIIAASKKFGATQALDNVDLVVMQNEIHGIIGRNGAGKSTLIKMIMGSDTLDSGAIAYFGQRVKHEDLKRHEHGLVETVEQHPPLVDLMTVAENIFLYNYPGGVSGFVSWREMHVEAARILNDWGIGIDPSVLVRDLPAELRGLVQIARVLNRGARIILLDEPTVQLDKDTITALFQHIRTLRDAGVTFLYVSHFLDEVNEICDRVTVLRDGKLLWTREADELTQDDLVQAILGDEAVVASKNSRDLHAEAEIALSVEQLADRKGNFRDVSFSLKRGEFVAIGGLVGSGKEMLGEVLVGAKEQGGGNIVLHGKRARFRSYRDAKAAGIGHVPPDRHASGYIPALSVAENMTLALKKVRNRAGFIRTKAQKAFADSLAQRVSLVPADTSLSVQSLSGGNQQKVVFARATAENPRVLILSSPTAGIDIAAKGVIYDLIERELEKGTAVLLISDDLEELVVAPRVLIMYRGQISSDLSAPNEEELTRAMEGPSK